MEVSPLKIKSQKLTKIKVENPESPLSKSLILERRLCLALAGLSLQKIKIALVGSGRRSEDFRGPISECRGCFTLQIDRFTMGGVKMINHRGKNSSKRSVCLKKFKISSYQKAEISSKKSQNSNQLASQGLVYTVQFRLLD